MKPLFSRAPKRPWSQSWAVSALLTGALACTLASAQTPPPAAPPAAPPTAPPAWSQPQWQALWDAARHTSGGVSYEFKWTFFTDITRARMARFSGLRNAAPQRAVNLLGVPAAIRPLLANLYLPGDRSEVVPYTNRGTAGWVVVELVQRTPAPPLRQGAEFEAAAMRWVASGNLPDPDTLLADLQARARAAYWNANTPAAVAAIPADLSPNIVYGNLSTPLLQAILANRIELAQALIDRGADTNLCGLWGCPIQLAADAPDEATATNWVPWLLARGARADAVALEHVAGNSTALATTMRNGRRALAEQLLAAGASPDGVPGVRTTPLEAAAVAKRRDLVEWLIARGASVLPHSDRSQHSPGERGNLVSAAASTGDKSFAEWAERTVVAAARASPRFRFDAHVEQGGRRQRLADGATVTLKAAPFSLVMTLRPGESSGVTMGASFEASWMEEVRRADLRNPMFRPFSSAATSEPPKPESYELFTGQPCPANAKVDDTCPGVQVLMQTDASARRDFHEVRTASHEYVREVRSVYDVSGDAKTPAVPLEQLAGKTLYMVLTDTVNLGGIDGLRHIGPRYVTVRLQK